MQQPDLFAPPAAPAAPKPTKRDMRKIRLAWQDAVKSCASRVLSWDLLTKYAVEAGNELIAISVDGSGPPDRWHEYVVRRLAEDRIAAGHDPACVRGASDPALVKIAIRIGRLPRSIIETMPPKPSEPLATGEQR